MQTYKIDTPDGASYQVEAENDAQAQSAINSYTDTSFDPEKAVSNIIPDLKGIGSTLATPWPLRMIDLATHGAAKIASGESVPGVVMDAAKEVARPVMHPLDFSQEHPVQQALNILSVLELATKGTGAVLNKTPMTENLLPELERHANNQTLKSFGGSLRQIKQMAKSGGREALDQAARESRSEGLADVFTTGIGREKTTEGLLNNLGDKLGVLRKEAGPAPSDYVNQLLESPKAKMDEYLGEGLKSGQIGNVDKAINDIKRIAGDEPTHANLAKAATYLNKQATEGKLYQPVTAETDVANALSDINNQGIVQKLGSLKGKEYVDILDKEKKLFPIKYLQDEGELREAGGRGGIGLQMVQKYMDGFGYRLNAKALAGVHDLLVSKGIPITKIAVANALLSLAPKSSINDLIGKLKDKYDSRRKM